MTTLVLATKNANKVRELSQILSGKFDATVQAYDGPEVPEDGTTFAENALIKARNAARVTGLPAIADDSGIAVDILGGSPGIFSARWAGPQRSDQDNTDLLIWQLTDVHEEHRKASFVCAAAFVLPEDVSARDGGPSERVVVAHWTGRVLTAPSGEGGFGYDPIFGPDGFVGSAAEMSAAEKNRSSHRFLAFSELTDHIVAAL